MSSVMKTKIEKGSKYLAAGIFFIALVLNMKITLDDPFILMSEAVVAQTTSTSSSTNSGTAPCHTEFILGGQVFPCGNGYEEGEVWGSMWCEGTGPAACISGSYYWILRCDGTQVGSSGQQASNCN